MVPDDHFGYQMIDRDDAVFRGAMAKQFGLMDIPSGKLDTGALTFIPSIAIRRGSATCSAETPFRAAFSLSTTK